MPRVLVTYTSVDDRSLAARTAMALIHRGVDVDVAPEQAVRRVAAAAYQRVVRAADQDLAKVLRCPRTPREGVVRIVGANDDASEATPNETPRLYAALAVIAVIVALLALA
jgi:hypothetical protein